MDRQPLYHLEKQFKQRYGVNISRRTMAQWLIDLAPKIQPVINLMKDQIVDYDIAAMDATSLQVLKESGDYPTKNPMCIAFAAGRPIKR